MIFYFLLNLHFIVLSIDIVSFLHVVLLLYRSKSMEIINNKTMPKPLNDGNTTLELERLKNVSKETSMRTLVITGSLVTDVHKLRAFYESYGNVTVITIHEKARYLQEYNSTMRVTFDTFEIAERARRQMIENKYKFVDVVVSADVQKWPLRFLASRVMIYWETSPAAIHKPPTVTPNVKQIAHAQIAPAQIAPAPIVAQVAIKREKNGCRQYRLKKQEGEEEGERTIDVEIATVQTHSPSAGRSRRRKQKRSSLSYSDEGDLTWVDRQRYERVCYERVDDVVTPPVSLKKRSTSSKPSIVPTVDAVKTVPTAHPSGATARPSGVIGQAIPYVSYSSSSSLTGSGTLSPTSDQYVPYYAPAGTHPSSVEDGCHYYGYVSLPFQQHSSVRSSGATSGVYSLSPTLPSSPSFAMGHGYAADGYAVESNAMAHPHWAYMYPSYGGQPSLPHGYHHATAGAYQGAHPQPVLLSLSDDSIYAERTDDGSFFWDDNVASQQQRANEEEEEEDVLNVKELMERISQLETIVKTQERKLTFYNAFVTNFQPEALLRTKEVEYVKELENEEKRMTISITNAVVDGAIVDNAIVDSAIINKEEPKETDSTVLESPHNVKENVKSSNWASDEEEEDWINDDWRAHAGDGAGDFDVSNKRKLFDVLNEPKFETRTVIYVQNIAKEGLDKNAFCRTILTTNRIVPAKVTFKATRNGQHHDKYYAFVYCKSHSDAIAILEHILLTPLTYKGNVLECNWANERQSRPCSTTIESDVV